MRTDRADRRLGYHFGNEVGEGAVEGFGAVIEHNGLFFRKCADGAGDGEVGVSDGDQRAQAKAVLDGALLVLGSSRVRLTARLQSLPAQGRSWWPPYDRINT